MATLGAQPYKNKGMKSISPCRVLSATTKTTADADARRHQCPVVSVCDINGCALVPCARKPVSCCSFRGQDEIRNKYVRTHHVLRATAAPTISNPNTTHLVAAPPLVPRQPPEQSQYVPYFER